MATRFPMSVKCYGRSYLVETQQELDQLLAWLVDGKLALTNRFRAGGSWPRGQRARAHAGYMENLVVRPQEPDGAVDLSECPTLRRCRCGKCSRCGAVKHSSVHGPNYGEAPGSAPWGHRYQP